MNKMGLKLHMFLTMAIIFSATITTGSAPDNNQDQTTTTTPPQEVVKAATKPLLPLEMITSLAYPQMLPPKIKQHYAFIMQRLAQIHNLTLITEDIILKATLKAWKINPTDLACRTLRSTLLCLLKTCTDEEIKSDWAINIVAINSEELAQTIASLEKLINEKKPRRWVWLLAGIGITIPTVMLAPKLLRMALGTPDDDDDDDDESPPSSPETSWQHRQQVSPGRESIYTFSPGHSPRDLMSPISRPHNRTRQLNRQSLSPVISERNLPLQDLHFVSEQDYEQACDTIKNQLSALEYRVDQTENRINQQAQSFLNVDQRSQALTNQIMNLQSEIRLHQQQTQSTISQLELTIRTAIASLAQSHPPPIITQPQPPQQTPQQLATLLTTLGRQQQAYAQPLQPAPTLLAHQPSQQPQSQQQPTRPAHRVLLRPPAMDKSHLKNH